MHLRDEIGERQLELVTFPDPVPGPDDVIIEVKASGMCGTDLHKYGGPKAAARPEIGGHEPAGVVVEVGSNVASSLVGQRVMVHHYQGCTTCSHCRTGWQQLCQRTAVKVYGNNSHGGHAPWMRVPANTLVPLPEELSFAAGAAISCGTGTAYGALRRMNLSGHDTIAVFGQGPVGLSATQLAAAMGARVIALDVSPERLERARAFGAVRHVSVDVVVATRDLCRRDDRDRATGRGTGRGTFRPLSASSNAARQMLGGEPYPAITVQI